MPGHSPRAVIAERGRAGAGRVDGATVPARRIVLAGAVAAAFAALAAAPGGTAAATPSHVEDARWAVFAQAKVTADPVKGEYAAVFGPALAGLQGRELTLSGYILPLGTDANAPHFVLTRRSAGCPFCPPDGPNEAVEVLTRASIAYTMAPVTVSGRLRLVPRSGEGLFFRLENAVVR